MNDLSKPREYIREFVSQKGNGQRLEEYLAEKVEWISLERLRDMINRGIITLNGENIRPEKILKTSDLIIIRIEDPLAGYIDPSTVEVSIVYEDEHMIVVNKQPGIMVHPAGKTLYGTLINGIHYILKQQDETCDPKLLHRLDKNTSGIILVSKTSYAHKILAKTFIKRQIRKTYHAICTGSFEQKEGTVSAPIGPAVDSHIKIKMMIDNENGKDAVTNYSIIKCSEKYSLVKAFPETGRQHQIRVHMAHIGHPIVNDTMYSAEIGSDDELLWDKNIRFYLHAHSIEILDCVLFNKEPRIFSAPYPEDFQLFIDDNLN